MGHWRKHYSHSGAKPHLKGQAILELAIFGSILIMLLGILINYGLRYNSEQKVMQQAFRKALAAAAVSMNPHTPTSTSHVLVQDKHIPNPQDPFAVGSVMPFSSGAGVTRSYKLEETPDYEDELPQVSIDIQGQEYKFKTAGFREEHNISDENLERYKEIYGNTIQGWSETSGWVNLDQLGTNDKTCIRWGPQVCYPTGCVQPCEEYTIKGIRFIDPSAGEIMNYDAAIRQCRQIVDTEACIKECDRGGGKDCANICGRPMNVPWYCQDYQEIDETNHRYVFSTLERIFAFAPPKQKYMGLQQGYTQRTSIQNRLDKKETTADIATTDRFDWQTQTERSIVHKTYGDTSTNTNTANIVTSAPANKTRTRNWQTKW